MAPPELPLRVKVVCFVVRGSELLVFRHLDYPEAGVQVPAGTVENGEDPPFAALRETEEETGYTGFTVGRKLGTYEYEFHDRFREGERHERHQRHVFALVPPSGLPENWTTIAEPGAGDFRFEFSWIPITPDIVLAGDQHRLLSTLRADVDSQFERVRVVCLRDGALLLVKHRASDGTFFWLLPGGGIKNRETIEAAAAREVWEEAGLRIRVRRRLVRPVTVTGAGPEHAFVLAEPLDTETRGPQPVADGDAVFDVAWHPITSTSPIGGLSPTYWRGLDVLLEDLIRTHRE